MPAKALARKARRSAAPRKVTRKAARKAGRSSARRAPAQGERGKASGRDRVAGTSKARPAARSKARAGGAKKGPEAVAAHFRRFPPERREPMLRLWAMVQEALPGSTAVVSYGIAIAAVGGRWVAGVGGGKAHLGLYLMSPAFVQAHAAELAGQDVSGGTVRFPLGKPLPGPLVRRLVRARLVSLGQQYGADEARLEPARLAPKPPSAPRPASLDAFPKPMLVPLDGPRKP